MHPYSKVPFNSHQAYGCEVFRSSAFSYLHPHAGTTQSTVNNFLIALVSVFAPVAGFAGPKQHQYHVGIFSKCMILGHTMAMLGIKCSGRYSICIAWRGSSRTFVQLVSLKCPCNAPRCGQLQKSQAMGIGIWNQDRCPGRALEGSMDRPKPKRIQYPNTKYMAIFCSCGSKWDRHVPHIWILGSLCRALTADP